MLTLQNYINNEKNNISIYNMINPIYTQYTTYYNDVINTFNKINIEKSTLETSIQNKKNSYQKSFDEIFQKLKTQLNNLNTAISNNKYDDIQKENETFKSINKQLTNMVAPIQKDQTDYNKQIGSIDILLSDLSNQITTFNNYVNKTVIPFIKIYEVNKEKLKNVNQYVIEANQIINKPIFSCVIKNDDLEPLDNICKFISNIDRINSIYNLLYTDQLSGIKTKILKYIEINKTLDDLFIKNFNKKFPDLSNENDISKFIDTLDISSIWNSKDGLNAIQNFKNSLKTYLTSYFKVLQKINDTFNIKATKIDLSLIEKIGGNDDKGGLIKENSNKIKSYGDIQLKNYENIVKSTKDEYEKMKNDFDKMASGILKIDDDNMKKYVTSIKKYETSLIENTKLYSTDISKIEKLYINPLQECSNTFNLSLTSSTNDIINSNNIVTKLVEMLKYQRAWKNTTVKSTSIEPFENNILNIQFTENLNRLNQCVSVSKIPQNILSAYEVTNGIWSDPNSSISSLDKMEGYITFVTTFNSNVPIININAKIFTNGQQPIFVYVNDINISPVEMNIYKFNFEAKENIIKIKVDLSSPINKKINSRYLLFSAKANNQLILTSNDSSKWKYVYEDNRYMKPITINGNSNSTCDTICGNRNALCNNAFSTISGSASPKVYDCNKIVTGVNNINCNCLPISSNESFTNEHEHFSSFKKNSSNYGGTNNVGTTVRSYDGASSFLANKNKVNSVILHKAPYKGDTYLTGATMVDTNNNIYPVGSAYHDDVQSKLYSCKSGFVGLKTNEKGNNIYNASLECNEPIYEEDNLPYMSLIKENSKNIVYGKADNISYPSNTIFEDNNMKFEDCPKKCNETQNCIGYVTQKIKNVCNNVEKCETKDNMRERDCKAQGAKDIWDCDKSCKKGAFGKKYGCDEGCKCKFCTTVNECKDMPQSAGCTFKSKFEYNNKVNTSNFDTYYIKPSNNNSKNTVVPTPFDKSNYFEYIDNEDEISRNNNPNLLKSIKKIIKK